MKAGRRTLLRVLQSEHLVDRKRLPLPSHPVPQTCVGVAVWFSSPSIGRLVLYAASTLQHIHRTTSTRLLPTRSSLVWPSRPHRFPLYQLLGLLDIGKASPSRSADVQVIARDFFASCRRNGLTWSSPVHRQHHTKPTTSLLSTPHTSTQLSPTLSATF